MAGERRDYDGLNGRMEALDVALAQLLDVQPSPDFAARVRQAVRAAPPRAAWGLVWKVAAASVVIAAIALSFVMRPPTSAPESVSVGPVPAPSRVPGMGPPPAAARPQPTRVPARPPLRQQPVVIVDEGQRAALNVMMQLVQEGKLDSTMLETPPSTVLPLDANVEVAPLTVRPLEIVPIPGARTDQK